MAPFFFFFLPASFPTSGFGKGENIYFYETLEECNTLITLIVIIAYDGHNVYNDVDNIYFLFLRILLELTLARNIYDYYFERRRRKEYLFEFNFYRKIYSKKVNISRNGYKYWISDEQYFLIEKNIYITNIEIPDLNLEELKNTIKNWTYFNIYFNLEKRISFLPLKEDGEEARIGSINVNRVNRSDYRE